jgi:hypothetical protein
VVLHQHLIEDLELLAPRASLPALEAFYAGRLKLPVARRGDALELRIGAARLRFEPAQGNAAPWYHVALRLAGARFSPAYEWLRERVDVLTDHGGDRIAVFDRIGAVATYFHDPAMNIMELISFHDLDREEDDHPFDARELLGVAEVGLVSTDPAAIDARLRAQAGIEIWSGTVAEPGRMALAFTGARGHSLILAPAGRPWLPQGRISEAHPLRARVGEAELVYDGGMLNVSMRR